MKTTTILTITLLLLMVWSVGTDLLLAKEIDEMQTQIDSLTLRVGYLEGQHDTILTLHRAHLDQCAMHSRHEVGVDSRGYYFSKRVMYPHKMMTP